VPESGAASLSGVFPSDPGSASGAASLSGVFPSDPGSAGAVAGDSALEAAEGAEDSALEPEAGDSAVFPSGRDLAQKEEEAVEGEEVAAVEATAEAMAGWLQSSRAPPST
jgi:hypothetical protein